MKKRLLVVTGEVSGDTHAAGVLSALRRRFPDLECSGSGGEALRAAGAEILFDVNAMAVVGGTEALAKLWRLRRIFLDLLAHMRANPPDAVLLVDYPGFNLRFARRAHAMGTRTLYYICPQVWAWRRSRIGLMANCIHRLITIFPFEPRIFASTGPRTDFAGHPLVDETRRLLKTPAPELPWQNGSPRIALLPGSRTQEIKRLLPIMWAAAKLFQKIHPDSAFIIPAVSPAAAAELQQSLQSLANGPQRCNVVACQTLQVLRQAAAAVVASGTATLEAAFMNCPTVVAYRTGHITYALGRRLVNLRHIGIVNILAGREVSPELLQGACRPERIVKALEPLAFDSPERLRMQKSMCEVVATLGDGGAYENAAAIVAQELDRGR